MDGIIYLYIPDFYSNQTIEALTGLEDRHYNEWVAITLIYVDTKVMVTWPLVSLKVIEALKLKFRDFR